MKPCVERGGLAAALRGVNLTPEFSRGTGSLFFVLSPTSATTPDFLSLRLTHHANPCPSPRLRAVPSSTPEALQAIQVFLRFQISDHQTGDATEVR